MIRIMQLINDRIVTLIAIIAVSVPVLMWARYGFDYATLYGFVAAATILELARWAKGKKW